MKISEASSRSEFTDALQKGVLLGAAILLLVLPPRWVAKPVPPASPAAAVSVARTPVPAPVQLADFGNENPSPDVRHIANWAVYTHDYQNRSFVVVDKKAARVYVFDPKGKLKTSTTALLGSAIGDDNAPGIGDKPLSQVLPEERTTPAGRFIAKMGMDARHEDVVWVDYDAAVSMHRVLTTNPAEHRLERLASSDVKKKRISYGCINLPVSFYENVLRPVVKGTGAVIYVLPETRPAQAVFGSFDVPRAASTHLARGE